MQSTNWNRHAIRYISFQLFIMDLQYRSASLSINPAFRAGACTDCEYIECTIAIIIIVILARSLFFSLLTMLVLIRLTKEHIISTISSERRVNGQRR